MDNLFEILIYVIIIISFLSSIFKKKQQPQKKPPMQQPHQEDYYQVDESKVSVPQTQRKEEYDILEELEDFFKVGEETTVEKLPIPKVPSENIPKIEEHTKVERQEIPTVLEQTEDDWARKKDEVRKRMARVDSGVEKQAALFEESLERKVQFQNDLVLSIRSKFRNPSTLKEYIIFSEILGKPKAFRR